jgi:hypothetical protein
MWKDAAGALKWIADKLIKRHSETAQNKRQKWLQVADYLESVAKLIDASGEDFKNNRIPHGHYGQLYGAAGHFSSVLSQVYTNRDYETVQRYKSAFEAAVHLIEVGDAMVLECADEPFTEAGQQVLSDLQAAAGHFRGLAMTIKAMA